jgi:hypothetical protein
MSFDIAQHFDLVFPAHSNGQTYLHGGSAIVGSVQPCAVFQWTQADSGKFFEKYSDIERSNQLYGKFNSYKGRCGLRDGFLKKVSSVYSPNEVQVIAHQQNRWNYGTPEDRFREMMAHKVIICNPIYNDIPARLFDALVVGAIPIVPHGLPELNRCFSRQDLAELPVISYIPDSISSPALSRLTVVVPRE